jgi:MFS family permease
MLVVFAIAIIAGGMTFNVTTISMPKVIDEKLGLDLSLAWTGSLATGVFIFGALTQLAVGRLVDRLGLPTLFVGLAMLQPIGLGVAATTSGVSLLFGLFLVTAAIYGQVVVNDAMVARYVPAAYRAKAFSVRYFLGFTASGFAAQMIAWLHARGGFSTVLAATAAFGATVLACALLFKFLADGAASNRAISAGIVRASPVRADGS